VGQLPGKQRKGDLAMTSPVRQPLNPSLGDGSGIDVLALLAKIEREQEKTGKSRVAVRRSDRIQPETDESPGPVFRESTRTWRHLLLALIWTALVALAVAVIVAWRSLNTLISLPVL